MKYSTYFIRRFSPAKTFPYVFTCVFILIFLSYIIKNMNDAHSAYVNLEHGEILYRKNNFKLIDNSEETIFDSDDYSKSFDESVLSAESLSILRNVILCEKVRYRRKVKKGGGYTVHFNYIKAEAVDLECYESVTFTTHGEFSFLEDLEVIVQRWLGPVSVAVYAPGTDFLLAVDSVLYLRECSQVSDLIKKWISFHIYYDTKHTPQHIPEDPLNGSYNCSSLPPYKQVSNDDIFKYKHNLKYPVNMGRNIAIDASMTYYVLSLDIELYPSYNLGTQFLNMIARNSSLLHGPRPRVFAIKPFEIKENLKIPNNKTELMEMLQNHQVVLFHIKVCPQCHRSPLTKEWMQQGQTKYMSITGVGKRHLRFSNWEAIFIGTKDDPWFDERLMWEGKRDKMVQSYLLCLLDYDFLFLSNAFVIHHPGIKVYQQESNHMKKMMNAQNRFIRRIILPYYHKKYGEKDECEF